VFEARDIDLRRNAVAKRLVERIAERARLLLIDTGLR